MPPRGQDSRVVDGRHEAGGDSPQREFRIYQAGHLVDLPGITAPRCWGARDRPGEGTWL
jgi:hypothetical protein